MSGRKLGRGLDMLISRKSKTRAVDEPPAMDVSPQAVPAILASCRVAAGGRRA